MTRAMPVQVRWGPHHFAFQLPRPDTTLAAVRQSIAAYTGLDPAAFAIVHDGAVLADDAQPSACPLSPATPLTATSLRLPSAPQLHPRRRD